MRRTRSTTILYAILGSGVSLAFLGHGILGTKSKESFIELVTGTYDNVLGSTMSASTAETWVNIVGWLDVTLAVVFAGLVVAAIAGKAIAYSTPAMILFGWAAVWGFLTALSRYTAEPDGIVVWDVVERGPNYLLPAGLVYLIYRIAKPQAVEPAVPIADAPTTNGAADRERVLADMR